MTLSLTTLPAIPRPLLLVLALAAGELAAVSLLYTLTAGFECRDVASPLFCGQVSMLATRALLVICFLAMAILARPGLVAPLSAAGGLRARPWLWMHGTGVGFILAPWFLLADLGDPRIFGLTVSLWAAGGLTAAVGALLAAAPPAAWLAVLRRGGVALAGVLALAAVLPEATEALYPIWRSPALTDATFAAVVMLSEAFGQPVTTEPARHLIDAGDFEILVGRPCSGIEGFVLITAFTAGYLWLFRAELRFPYVLLLLPAGLLASWGLNVVRITALVAIGENGAPDLAVGGFHSHAGWLMFSMLALGLIAVSRLVPAFRRAGPAVTGQGPPPLLQDRTAAEILPFVAFMGAALVTSTFSSEPALLYPVKALAMAAALLAFRPLILALPWRIDALSVAAGLLIGAAWIAAEPPQTGPHPATALAPALLAGWAVFRVIGTVILVPVVEELFFRGYLLRRIGVAGGWMALVAVVASAGLFAVLHERWLLAAGAGLVFGALVLRSGRVTDAIVAHMAANALIAAWAAATARWDMI